MSGICIGGKSMRRDVFFLEGTSNVSQSFDVFHIKKVDATRFSNLPKLYMSLFIMLS